MFKVHNRATLCVSCFQCSLQPDFSPEISCLLLYFSRLWFVEMWQNHQSQRWYNEHKQIVVEHFSTLFSKGFHKTQKGKISHSLTKKFAHTCLIATTAFIRWNLYALKYVLFDSQSTPVWFYFHIFLWLFLGAGAYHISG